MHFLGLQLASLLWASFTLWLPVWSHPAVSQANEFMSVKESVWNICHCATWHVWNRRKSHHFLGCEFCALLWILLWLDWHSKVKTSANMYYGCTMGCRKCSFVFHSGCSVSKRTWCSTGLRESGMACHWNECPSRSYDHGALWAYRTSAAVQVSVL